MKDSVSGWDMQRMINLTTKLMGSKPQVTDRIFLDEWVKQGYNSKAAYLSLKPNVKPDSAKEMGKRKLASCKASGVYNRLLDKAYNNINTLLDSDNERIKLDSTKDLLDRANGKAQGDSLLGSGNNIQINILTDEQQHRIAARVLRDGKTKSSE